MSKTFKVLLTIIVILVVVIGIWFYVSSNNTPTSYVTPTQPVVTNTPPADTYGMSEYTDSNYGFSFWYPSALKVTSTTTNDTTSFPGGTAVETLLVGDMGSTSVVVVNSPTSTITDEPNGHASPISQTKYSYDNATGEWMISHPEAPANGEGSATPTLANTSNTTISGLFMLPGKRFDTTIIPLTTTQFLVVSDGGGSFFTSQLAATVAQNNVSVDPTLQATALQAEATAYNEGK